MNSFGRRLRIQILGESHGHGIGIVLDGVPPGIPVDEDRIAARMAQRRPGVSRLTTQRDEADAVHIRSGVHNDHTTGAPVLLWIDNADTRSKDYDQLLRLPRPGHSDWVAGVWANGFQDHRGGGHYSGRLTAPLVAAAALIEPLLAQHGIHAAAHVHSIGHIMGPEEAMPAIAMRDQMAKSEVHTAHADTEAAMVQAIDTARSDKDSLGGIVRFTIDGVPPAWGDPFFDTIESHLAHLFFAVPAVKAVGFGAGARAAAMTGSEHNDAYRIDDGHVTTATNNAGGILGGRSTGKPIWGDVTIKPTSSIFQPQDTVDLQAGTDATLELKGRHDPCIAIRAAPVIRAACELGIADMLLLAKQEGHA